MRRYYNLFLTIFTASSQLFSQGPTPICGFPHISQIPPDALLTLYKAVGMPTGDRRFRIREDVTSSSADFIEVDCY